MKSLIRLFIVFPIAIVVVMLAVANRRTIPLSFNPLDPDNSATIIEVPIFWLVFACVAAGIVLGGMAVWFKQGRHRKAARANRREAAKFKAETERQREQLVAIGAEGTQKGNDSAPFKGKAIGSGGGGRPLAGRPAPRTALPGRTA